MAWTTWGVMANHPFPAPDLCREQSTPIPTVGLSYKMDSSNFLCLS